MKRIAPRFLIVAVTLLCTIWSTATCAPANHTVGGGIHVRKLLYPTDKAKLPKDLAEVVGNLRSKAQPQEKPRNTHSPHIFLRVMTRKNVLHKKLLNPKANLAGRRCFAFVTLPEMAHGRSLLDIYRTIGYDPADILGNQMGEEKVVVVFSYTKDIQVHEDPLRGLPLDRKARIYRATWGNLLPLVDRIAEEKCQQANAARKQGTPESTDSLGLSVRQWQFLCTFPDAGRQRIQTCTYPLLRDTGGADWVYRSLLETVMGANEHFTGDGSTKVTFQERNQTDPVTGYPEYLAPDKKLSELPALAVVSLGSV